MLHKKNEIKRKNHSEDALVAIVINPVCVCVLAEPYVMKHDMCTCVVGVCVNVLVGVVCVCAVTF